MLSQFLNMSTPKKRVVIIGCGYGGSSVAKALDKHAAKGEIELTVITKREGFLLNKYSALRAAARADGWAQRTLIPLSNLMKHGTLIQGQSVTAIDSASRNVKLDDGREIGWDVLCIASGSRNFSPAEPPIDISTVVDTAAYYAKMSDTLSRAKNILIVGTGPVSIELAGELSSASKLQPSITLVSHAKEILTSPTPLSASNIQAAKHMLSKNKIETILHDEVVSEQFPADTTMAIPIVSTPNGVDLKSGRHVDCDTLIYTVGSKLTTSSFVPSEWMDAKTKEVLVDIKTLAVKGRNDVFCVGDAARTEATKLGYTATEDGKVVAANIMQVVKGKPATHTVSRAMSSVIVLPFGPHKGRILTPYFNMGDWAASKVKGAGLYTKLMWGELVGKQPPAAD